jgi:TRAP-type uncharacterized transport system fused permease subunit
MLEKFLGPDFSLIGGSWSGLFIDWMIPWVMLMASFNRKLFSKLPVLPVMVLWAFGMFFTVVGASILTEAHWQDFVVYGTSYGIYLYIAICEWMLRGGAEKLTRRRGTKWIKEIDYLYIGLGALGAAFAFVNLSNVIQKPHIPETLSPVLVVTALVLRLVKTRAEIENWNKTTKTKRISKRRSR